MGLKEIISRVSILAKLGEDALQGSTSEMELIMIDRIFKTVKALHLFLAALKPSCCPVNRHLNILVLSLG